MAFIVIKVFSNGIHQFVALDLPPSDFRMGPHCEGQSFSPERQAVSLYFTTSSSTIIRSSAY
jgi:hypothetical protein